MSELEQSPIQLTDLLQVIRANASNVRSRVRFHDVGTVQRIGDGVATISGLPGARIDELVTFSTGVRGLVFSLDRNLIDVILLGPDEGIHGGDLVTAKGERLRIPVGARLLNRVVDPLGRPLDGRGAVGAVDWGEPEGTAPGIVERAPVNEPLHTGVKVVDALVPIGRGQRELILGDRQTGKTTLAVDAILSQHFTNMSCVYVAIGQKKTTTLGVIEALKEGAALPYTVVVASSPDDPPALRYLAPYAGCAMAEHLMRSGRDVLIVYDDLTRHADTYRELSLLLRRPPGREAYPGDVFYLHSRLLERACKLHEDFGGGSLTALPIVETQRGNISAYIPTNLISITDGQIVLDAEQFSRGIKPAVDAGRSVSRVGSAAQTSAMRTVAQRLRLDFAQYEEVSQFARFGAEVDRATQRQIRRGEHLQAAFQQPAHQPLQLWAQITVLLAATEGFLDDISLPDIPEFESELLAHIDVQCSGVCSELNRSGVLDEDSRDTLLEGIREFLHHWLQQRGNP